MYIYLYFVYTHKQFTLLYGYNEDFQKNRKSNPVHVFIFISEISDERQNTKCSILFNHLSFFLIHIFLLYSFLSFILTCFSSSLYIQFLLHLSQEFSSFYCCTLHSFDYLLKLDFVRKTKSKIESSGKYHVFKLLKMINHCYLYFSSILSSLSSTQLLHWFIKALLIEIFVSVLHSS